MSDRTYLKFAGPVLDEDTIAGVGDVLRSGWITSGPWVQRFEASLSVFCATEGFRLQPYHKMEAVSGFRPDPHPVVSSAKPGNS